jgi:hypothetical protein
MPTRRTLIMAGAGAAAIALTGAGMGAAKIAQAQEATSATGTATTCVLTPVLPEGPYYLDDMPVRTDIPEGKPGVPLTLRIAVQDVTNCGPGSVTDGLIGTIVTGVDPTATSAEGGMDGGGQGVPPPPGGPGGTPPGDQG